MNVAICLDKVGWKVKPQNESDMIRINNRIAKCRTTIEENEAIELIANQGHSFTPTIFKGQRRKQEDFDELQWFVLDFDSGVSYEAIKARCQECGIPILFSYHTFSSTPETLQTATFCGQQGRISRTVQAILSGQPGISAGQRVLRPTNQYCSLFQEKAMLSQSVQ